MAMRASTALGRDAYPDGILFREEEGVYWLRDSDLAWAKHVIGFCCDGESIGLDSESASYYAQSLLEQGERVGILRGNTVRPLALRPPMKPTKVASTTIRVAPVLLFGQRELTRLCRVHTRRRAPMGATVEQFRQELVSGNEAAVRDAGSLYVYQVGQEMYEIDPELTGVSEQVVEALAVATHLEGQMLRCQLVLPKAKRNNKSSEVKPRIVVSEPIMYGQLRLAL